MPQTPPSIIIFAAARVKITSTMYRPVTHLPESGKLDRHRINTKDSPVGITPATPPRRRPLAVIVGWAAVIALLWIIEVVDQLAPADLDGYGVVPRDVGHLPNIAFVPFLHSGFDHLSANTVPLALLGVLSALMGLSRFWWATGAIVVVSGLGVWLFEAPHTVTVGASGVVFGYFGYLVGSGVFNRRMLNIVVAVIVVVLYGSILWGVLPNQPGISWLGHLFGLIGGVVAAWFLRTRRQTPAVTS